MGIAANGGRAEGNAMRKLKAVPEWLKAGVIGRPIGVDRENKVLRGYVLAQAGPFKSEGRGEFDHKSLQQIITLGNAKGKGLKARFTHPDMSGDALGTFLGRSCDLVLSTAKNEAGETVQAVRGDLHFDPSAFDAPKGNLAGYVMDLADSDPDALSSSLALQVDKEYRLKPDGTRLTGDDGEELPPLWRPKVLHASDIVDTGDAVDGLLSAGVDTDSLPLAALWRGAELLDSVFAGQSRDAVQARCEAWLGRYLSRRYGEAEEAEERAAAVAAVTAAGGNTDVLRRRLDLRGKA
jgi:hypothetical protein